MRALDLLRFADATPVLTVRALRKSFARGLARAHGRTFALWDVDLTVALGEVLCIAGDEGAGKTALVQCAAGLLRADDGAIRWFGDAIVPGVIPPGVAYVAAMPVYYPFLRVRDVVQLRTHHRDVAEPLAWTSRETLALLELDSKLDCVIADLSRAELRALSIVEAMIQNPIAILIDTSPAESKSFAKPAVAAIRAFAEKGGAVVIAVRDAIAVAQASTRIVMLQQGTIARTFYWDAVLPGAQPPLVLAETLH